MAGDLGQIQVVEELRRLRAALDAVPDAILLIDGTTLAVVDANAAACRGLGYSSDELRQRALPQIVPPASLEDLVGALGAAGDGEPQGRVIRTAHLHRNGETFPAEWHVRTLAGDATPLWIVTARPLAGSPQDSTACRQHPDRPCAAGADCDPLTGLVGRRTFTKCLARAAERARQGPGHSLAVLFVDLDYFKTVNDRFGHAAGDSVLCAVARRLSQCVRPGDVVARLGGDEYTVLVDRLPHADDAIGVAQRICARVRQPTDIGGQALTITASVGVALSSPQRTQAQDLLADADRAMYQAKSLGRNRLVVFSDELGWRPAQPR